MKRYVNLLVLLATLLCCKKEDTLLPITQAACFESRPVAQQANELTGVVNKSPDKELYSITYSVPGTFDSRWLGFVCNLPNEHKVVGKQVVFSGEYRTGPIGLTEPAGTEVYYLFLTSIRAK